MPRAAECEYQTKCFRIGLANPEVKEPGWQGVGGGQCNRNKEEYRSEEKVG